MLVVASVFYSSRSTPRRISIRCCATSRCSWWTATTRRMSRRFARWLDATEGVAVAGPTRGSRGGAGGRARGHGGRRRADSRGLRAAPAPREPATLTTYADGSYLLVRNTVAASVNAVAAPSARASRTARHRWAWRAGPCSIRSERTPPSFVPAVFILVLQQTLLIGMGTLRVVERHRAASDPGRCGPPSAGSWLSSSCCISSRPRSCSWSRSGCMACRSRPTWRRGRLPHPVHHREHPARPRDRRAVRTTRVVHPGARSHVRARLVLSGISFPWEDQAAWVRPSRWRSRPRSASEASSRSARWAPRWRKRGDRGARSGSRP